MTFSECVCEDFAQITSQFIFYSKLKLSKNTPFLCVDLNANKLMLPDPFREEGRALRAHAPTYQQQ